MYSWIKNLGGKFVVFDGPDGSGKTTQFGRFAELCTDHGLKVCRVREPGGTEVGELVRGILLDPAHARMTVRCELMLYMASRAQLLEQVVVPALADGQLVLADRFISSTLAYQGTAGGIPREEILEVGRVAIGSRWPDLTVIFDVDEKAAASRIDATPDRMEQKGIEFQRRVREGYLQQAREDPGHYLVIDATPEADEVFEGLCEGVREATEPRSD